MITLRRGNMLFPLSSLPPSKSQLARNDPVNMSTVVHNPTVPLTMSLPSGRLQAGTIIMIYGEPTPGPHRFAVNLKSLARNATCVFHFDARFDQGQTVRNSNYPTSDWGPEERSHLPFQPQRPFALELRCLHDRYVVAIDGNHFCEYHHRAPYTEVDALEVQGSVRITYLEIRAGGSGFPSSFPLQRLNVSNPVLPFVSLIGRLEVGGEIQVHGLVKPYANRFHVNLQQGTNAHPHSIIALHFNPRFQGDNIVVLNSWINSWGTEQRTACGTLMPGSNFVLVIKRKQHHYKISVNGSRLAIYDHRISADIVDALAIDGDAIVNRVIAF